MGISAMRRSISESGLLGEAFDRARHAVDVVKDRKELYRDGKPADDLRPAAGQLGAALSHRANCRHPRIGIRAVAWKAKGRLAKIKLQ